MHGISIYNFVPRVTKTDNRRVPLCDIDFTQTLLFLNYTQQYISVSFSPMEELHSWDRVRYIVVIVE